VRVFGFIWFGQLVSLIGSGITSFALGIWVYEHTGSVTQYALVLLATALPNIVVSPFAGALVDRWDRRQTMIFSDLGAALSTLAIVLLLSVGHLEVWHIYLATAVNSAFSAFQWPAYIAAISLLVPKQHLGRAGGMVQLGQAASQVVSPMLGGALLALVQVWGVLLIDVATFLFALFTLFMVSIPGPHAAPEGEERASSLLREIAYGWSYITARPGLLGLLIFFATSHFLGSIVETLSVPLLLSLTTSTVLGTVLSVGGSGMLVGGLVMGIWGGPKRRVNGVLAFELLGGLFVLVAGLWTSVPLFTIVAFVFFFRLPIVHGCRQAIWQSKVVPDAQGRTFAVQRMASWSSRLLAYLVAGPLADGVFEPLLAANGPLAGSVGRIVGVGPGRGIGLLFVVTGALVMLASIVGYLYPRLRLVEDELPDVVAD
jgi:DHA3 family macrolide efflux protein-like MFS transporter